MEVRERIRIIRDQKGIRAKDIAVALGMARPSYTLIEVGRRRLTADHVQKIARVLGVTVAALYGEVPMPEPPPKKRLSQINTPALRKRLQPLLKERTDDAVDCLQLWFRAPGQLKRALQVFHEKEEEGE